jgi:hypothetical protein
MRKKIFNIITRREFSGPTGMAYHGQACNSVQHHASAVAAKITGTEPGGKHMAVQARQLAVQPRLQILRPYRRIVLRCLEQPHRPTVENNVHRTQKMGS